MANIVVYTAIFGGKDELIAPTAILPECDLVCFTDQPLLVAGGWQIRHEQSFSEDPVRNAKVFKILPHRYFPEYQYSVWVDGNILIRGNVAELVEQHLSQDNIAFFSHNQNAMDPRRGVYEEAELLIQRAHEGKPKDDPELIARQVARYRREGFPDDGGLVVGMEVIRRHHAPDVVQAMEDWWAEIQNGSRRDQLSFNYIAWKNRLAFTYIDGDSRDNPYFLWRPHTT